MYADCEPGAVPPFGNLYFQRVFVDQSLVGNPEMVFNAGTHTDAIRMHYADFAELAQPVVGALCRLSCRPSQPPDQHTARCGGRVKSIYSSSTRDVITIDSSMCVLEAARRMTAHQIGALPVVTTGNRLVGIFTERDILARVVAISLDPRDDLSW